MTNYRVQQVLALGTMPERQLRLLVALATWMNDQSREVRVAFGTVIKTANISVNTGRKARKELNESGKLAYTEGRGRGNKTVWTVLCLPEKGTSAVGTFSDAAKGTNSQAEKVPTEAGKRYQGKHDDQPKSDHCLDLRSTPTVSRGAAGLIRSMYPDATDTEIDEITRDKTTRGARSVVAVLAKEVETRQLRLLCGKGAETNRRSEACLSRTSGQCRMSWCECRCHAKPGSESDSEAASAAALGQIQAHGVSVPDWGHYA